MKKSLLLLCLTICFSTLSFSQIENNKTENIKYFDENYNQISKTDFEDRRRENRFWSIQGDSLNHQILVFREIHGTIANKGDLNLILASATNKNIDSSKPLVIFYYPGKDLCNSTGTADREHFKRWYRKMERGVNRIQESTFVYLYKDDEGLYDKYDGFKNWIKDPDNLLERLFFKHHYPCSSFVVISESGKFISRFGESSKDHIWKAVKKLTKN